MTIHARRAGAGVLALLFASAATAQGVPESAVAVPAPIAVTGAAEAPRATLDEPAGPPPFDPRLPRDTPDGEEARYEAPPAPVTTFAEALDRAYWTNPRLLAERARLRAADYRLPQARAAFGPKLSVEATYGYERQNFESGAGFWSAREGWTTTASAVLNQPVFTFGRNAAAERSAVAEIAFQRSALRSAEIETLLNAVAVYAAVLRDRAGVDLLRDDLALLEREYADNVGRFGKREVTASDVQQVETRLEQSRAQLYIAQRTAASSEAAFLATVGAPAGVLAAPNPLAIPVRTLEEAYAQADANSPVLGAAYARERISRAGRDAARADQMPRIDLRGSALYGTATPYNNDPRMTTVRGQVVLSSSLFESGLRRARLSEAEAANDADWRLIDAALRDNRSEVAQSWNEWLAQSASIERLRVGAEAARLAFEGALLQEKAGLRSTLDVLNLARELLSTRSAYNAATASAYIAQARLLAAMGALEHKALFPDAPAYDPDDHFDRVKNVGSIPLVTPVLSAIDGGIDRVRGGGRRERPVRDPSAGTAASGVALPVPLEPEEAPGSPTRPARP